MSNIDLLFEKSMQRAWHGLGAEPPQSLMPSLLSAYAQPQRAYHTQQHLAECLAHFEAVQALAQRPAEVEIALWFHDAVYEVKAQDNELRSADWAAQVLTRAGIAAQVAQRVHALIMATCHTATPEDADAQLLVDIDLAILGAAPERFAQYDSQVRQEYAWVPSLIYGFKRKQVLRSFLDRPNLYSTIYFQQKLEQQARENLRKAING